MKSSCVQGSRTRNHVRLPIGCDWFFINTEFIRNGGEWVSGENKRMKMSVCLGVGFVHRWQDSTLQYMKQSEGYLRLKRKRKESTSQSVETTSMFSLFKQGQYARRFRFYTPYTREIDHVHLVIKNTHVPLHHRLLLSPNSAPRNPTMTGTGVTMLRGTECDLVVIHTLIITTAAAAAAAASHILAINPGRVGRSASSWRVDQPRLQL